MRIARTGGLAALCAVLLSPAAQAVTGVYTFSGGGGISPQANASTSGWMTENRTTLNTGLQPATVLDNGVAAGASYLSGLAATFDGTYSGTVTVVNDVVTAGTLSWTGTIGFEASTAPGNPGAGGIYAIVITNGSYDLVTGAYTGTAACAANPFGVAPTACASNFYPSVMVLENGTTIFTDNGNGTVTLQVESDDFTDNGGVKDTPFPGSGNGSLGYNHKVTWTVHALPANDADGDGVADASDNCPNTANANQADNDGDLRGNACDNCRERANNTGAAAQCDSDSDGFGNRCDADMNQNNSTNAQDTTLYRQQLGQPSVAPTYNKADLNCSGAVNAQDTTLFRQLLGVGPGPGAGP